MSLATHLRRSLAALPLLALAATAAVVEPPALGAGLEESLVGGWACDDAPRFTQAEPGEARSGGQATVRKTDQNSFSMPSANLPPSRRVDFSVERLLQLVGQRQGGGAEHKEDGLHHASVPE